MNQQPVQIPAGEVTLQGDVTVPAHAQGLVVFAHGSGSSRLSPRNRFVARQLNEAGLATLLTDLLSEQEEEVDLVTRHLRFDIGLLARRLTAVTEWCAQEPRLARRDIGYFGSSTGAAAALIAASRLPDVIGAVVSRGGRPDLAMPVLDLVEAPTLLIVGGRDEEVIELNQEALARLQVTKTLEIVPGATHLFEEPGALEQVAQLAADWFNQYLNVPRIPKPSGAPRHAGA